MYFSEQVAQGLLQINAIKLSPHEPFMWASGMWSPIYCDNRIALSFPSLRDVIIKGFMKRATEIGDFDVIAGVATAGIPWGVLLSDRLNKPFIYVRDKPKGHGRQNQIEGMFEKGQRVLVTEDLISTGGSSLKAVESLRDAECNVVGVVAIFTYGFQRAAELFAQHNCPVKTISDYKTLIEKAVQEGYINKKDLATLAEWKQSPEKWSPVK